MKKILLLYIIFALLGVKTNAQCKLLTYSHNLQFENSSADHIIMKNICFNENMGLSYYIPQKSISLNSKPSNNNILSIPVTLFDNGKKQFLQLDIYLDTVKKESELRYYTQNWSSVSDELEHKNKEVFSEITNGNEKSSVKRNLKIVKTTETKVINGFSCNLILVSEYGKEYKVWYSSDYNYNWLFLNFIHDLTGVVVQIERENNVVLELLSIEELDFNKIEFSPLDFFKILCNWY